MRCKNPVFILGTLLLFILAACSSAECKKDVDCAAKPRNAYTAGCVEGKCQYTAIPNVCGNGNCEANENKCSCATDCGQCTGKVANSKYLTQQCVKDQCLEDVSSVLIKPIFSSAETPSLGDKYKIDTAYNSPFNVKKDTFAITITLNLQGAQNRDEHVQKVELLATTKDRRTITLATHDVDKTLWNPGSAIQEEIILDFPTVEAEGEFTNLILKVYYDYNVLQSGKKQQKQATFQTTYKEIFTFVNPKAQYPCPQSCDDKNQGTRDYCSAQTSNFCKHDPIIGTCGNFKCDGNENKCSCATDCGPCSGSAGSYIDFTCKVNQCVTVLKPGTAQQPSSLFDDRSLGPVQLNNNYKFTNPFNIKQDKMTLEFKVYRQDPSVSSITIETVRLLEGQQQIAELNVDKEISTTTVPVQIGIPRITNPEEDHTVTLGVWYKYVQEGTEKRGNFQKPLGKLTLIAPE